MCNLITKRDNVIPIFMFYPQASQVIISPNDVVVSTDTFSSWTQHADLDTGVGHISFSSLSSLRTKRVNLQMNNNLWFLKTPRCNVKLSIKFKNNTISTLQQVLLYRLWRHLLGNPRCISLRQSHASCDGFNNLTKPAFLMRQMYTSKIWET